MSIDIKQHVIAALVKTLKLKNISIKDHTDLRSELGLDSMSSLIFLMKLEETIAGFEINPDTLDSNSLKTVNTITQYVISELKS